MNIVKPFLNSNEKVILSHLWSIARVSLQRLNVAKNIANHGSGDQFVFMMKEYLINFAVAGAGCQVLINYFSRES